MVVGAVWWRQSRHNAGTERADCVARAYVTRELFPRQILAAVGLHTTVYLVLARGDASQRL